MTVQNKDKIDVSLKFILMRRVKSLHVMSVVIPGVEVGVAMVDTTQEFPGVFVFVLFQLVNA